MSGVLITPSSLIELVLPAAGNYLRVDWPERPRRFVLLGNRQKREQHLGYAMGSPPGPGQPEVKDLDAELFILGLTTALFLHHSGSEP